jgi:predicted GNAT family acetyltransferase
VTDHADVKVPSSEAAQTTVRDVPERHRYEISLSGETAGLAVYQDRPGGEGGGQRRVFVHTEIDPRLKGQGVGSRLVRAALDDVRTSGRRAVPVCPFVTSYLNRHHEYDDIVDPATPAILSSL